MMRYLPFAIISLILYTLFFYHNQEPKLLSADTDISAREVIPLNFKELEELERKNLIKEQPNKEPLEDRTASAVSEVQTASAVPPAIKPEKTLKAASESKTVPPTKNTLAITTASKATPTLITVNESTAEPVTKAPPQITTGTAETKTTPDITADAESTGTPEMKVTSEVILAPEVVMLPESVTPTKTALAPENVVINDTSSIPETRLQPQTSLEKKQRFQASIKSTVASDVALIKGELYNQNLLKVLTPPPGYKKPVSTKKITAPKSAQIATVNIAKEKHEETASMSSKLLQNNKQTSIQHKPNSTQVTKTEKPKRVFKKPVKPLQATTLPGLQVAIAVSGNKPTYPAQAKAEKAQGTVTAKFIVNMQGKSKNPQIIASSGHQVLDNALLKFIENERFMPALKGIEKVTSEQQLSFDYQPQ